MRLTVEIWTILQLTKKSRQICLNSVLVPFYWSWGRINSRPINIITMKFIIWANSITAVQMWGRHNKFKIEWNMIWKVIRRMYALDRGDIFNIMAIGQNMIRPIIPLICELDVRRSTAHSWRSFIKVHKYSQVTPVCEKSTLKSPAMMILLKTCVNKALEFTKNFQIKVMTLRSAVVSRQIES